MKNVDKDKLLKITIDMNKKFFDYLNNEAKKDPDLFIQKFSNKKIKKEDKKEIIKKSIEQYSENSYIYLNEELNLIKLLFCKETFSLLNFKYMDILLNTIKEMNEFDNDVYSNLINSFNDDYDNIIAQYSEFSNEIQKDDTFENSVKRFINDIEGVIKVKKEKKEEEHLKKIYLLIYNNMLKNKKESFELLRMFIEKADYRKDFEKYRESIKKISKVKNKQTAKLLLSIDKIKKSNDIIFNNLKK